MKRRRRKIRDFKVRIKYKTFFKQLRVVLNDVEFSRQKKTIRKKRVTNLCLEEQGKIVETCLACCETFCRNKFHSHIRCH